MFLPLLKILSTNRVTKEGLDLIVYYEGLHDPVPSTKDIYEPYMDPVGYWTVGVGHLIVHNGRKLKDNKDKELAYSLFPKLTKEAAYELLDKDLDIAKKAVARNVKIKLNNNQYSALVSWVFNLGEGNLQKSTLLKELNNGNFELAKASWKRYINAGGIPLLGLKRRRYAEIILFDTGKFDPQQALLLAQAN